MRVKTAAKLQKIYEIQAFTMLKDYKKGKDE